MTTLFRLKSHSFPEKKLIEHLLNVGYASRQKVAYYDKILHIEHKKTSLSQAAYIIGVCHDFAKATSYFQKVLNKQERRSVYSTHSGLSSLFTYYTCTRLIPNSESLWSLAYLAVKRHHGNLRTIWGEESNRDTFNLEVIKHQIDDIVSNESTGYCAFLELCEIYQMLLPQIDLNEFIKKSVADLVTRISRSLKNTAKQFNLDNYFLLLALYSSLQEADKCDAGDITNPPRSNQICPELITEYRINKFRLGYDPSDISHLRESCFNDVLNKIELADLKKERIFSITLPTGFGKTLAGMACAMRIRKKIEAISAYSPRIVYSLPFLSIIDQNAAVLKQILSFTAKANTTTIPSNLLLIHHHLADYAYRTKVDEEESVDHKSSIFLVEGWNSEIIITSFVQFFQSIITNNKNMLRKFNNISGSIILLDEIQAIPTKYWSAVDIVLNQLCKQFGCWIILMTATKPSILIKCRELADWKKYPYKDRVRYTFRNERLLEDVVKLVLSELVVKSSILIILNTIGESKEIYTLLKQKFKELFGDSHLDENGIRRFKNLHLIYLSSSVLPATRRKRIDRIKDLTEKNAIGNSIINEGFRDRVVVVSTQVVEAGVDIDMNMVIRDFAPLDCIIQSGGRCNRNSRQSVIGEVVIFPLKDNWNNKDYCRYVYDAVLLDKTDEAISRLGNSVGEQKMLEMIYRYFDKVLDSKAQDPVIDDMAALDFDKVGEFSLIENYDSVQVFLETDAEARRCRIQIEENSVSNKMNLVHQLKRIMNNNTVSVKKPKEIDIAKTLPRVQGTEIRFIPMNELNSWYDRETGLDLRLNVAIERRII